MSKEGTDDIEDAASAWLVRRDSGSWTSADERRFEQWLDASTLNRVAYLRLELAWEDAARLKALDAGNRSKWSNEFLRHTRQPDAQSPQIGPRGIEHPRLAIIRDGEAMKVPEAGLRRAMTDQGRSNRRRFLAAAAAILLGAGVSEYLIRVHGRDRYITPVGDIASVPMNDGSKVTLNTDSQISIALTDTERRVDLKQGEAFFEVAKDPTRPFVVRVGSKQVIAVGTKFSVRRDTDDLEVVVTEGEVRLECSGETVLSPGNIARVGDAGVLVERKSLPEAEEQLSWLRGMLMFRAQSLSDAVAEFNRYNKRKVVIGDAEVGTLMIEGNFRATNVSGFVRLLEKGFPVRATVENDRIVLTSR